MSGVVRWDNTGYCSMHGFDRGGVVIAWIYDEGGHTTEEATELCRRFNEHETLRARLAAAESRLREYEDAPVAGYYVYVAEHDNGYVCETESEYCDDATNHNAEITELIIRPRGGKGE